MQMVLGVEWRWKRKERKWCEAVDDSVRYWLCARCGQGGRRALHWRQLGWMKVGNAPFVCGLEEIGEVVAGAIPCQHHVTHESETVRVPTWRVTRSRGQGILRSWGLRLRG